MLKETKLELLNQYLQEAEKLNQEEVELKARIKEIEEREDELKEKIGGKKEEGESTEEEKKEKKEEWKKQEESTEGKQQEERGKKPLETLSALASDTASIIQEFEELTEERRVINRKLLSLNGKFMVMADLSELITEE